jgi:hypothetical protein
MESDASAPEAIAGELFARFAWLGGNGAGRLTKADAGAHHQRLEGNPQKSGHDHVLLCGSVTMNTAD